METTTTRVDTGTHRRLQAMSRRSGRTILETTRDAVDALDRVRFADAVAAEFDELRSQPDAWSAYLAEADELPVGDDLT